MSNVRGVDEALDNGLITGEEDADTDANISVEYVRPRGVYLTEFSFLPNLVFGIKPSGNDVMNFLATHNIIALFKKAI